MLRKLWRMIRQEAFSLGKIQRLCTLIKEVRSDHDRARMRGDSDGLELAWFQYQRLHRQLTIELKGRGVMIPERVAFTWDKMLWVTLAVISGPYIFGKIVMFILWTMI